MSNTYHFIGIKGAGMSALAPHASPNGTYGSRVRC